MKNVNTGNRPQTGCIKPANADWCLMDQEGNSLLYGVNQKAVIPEEVINEEGQTHSEWLSDLRRREREELIGDLSEFASDGVGYVFKGVVMVVKLFFGVVVGVMSYSRPKPSRSGLSNYPRFDTPKPKVNINVNVEGNADVDVSINVNTRS